MASGRGARPSLAALGLGLVGALVALCFPLAAARAVELWGARATGALVFGIGLASVLLSRRRSIPGLGPWLRSLALALPGLALISGNVRFLQLVPAAIELALCGVFLGSLRGGSSILQQAAYLLEPYAPDFIGPYCRKATAGFAALFAVQAIALAWVAFSAQGADWAKTSSLWVWLPTLAGTSFEFMLRKAWFRHYGENPVDRVLRVLLPPEKTATGRRSLDYIRRMRQELGMPPP